MVSEFWGKQKSRKKDGKKSVEELRRELEEKKMGELRSFVKKNKLKAADTSKPELIEEIIKEMEEK